MTEAHKLAGWSQISEYLGVSPRTAQGYERDLGLPIHRLPGPKGRVWAIVEELDAWRHNVPANPDEEVGPPRARSRVIDRRPEEELFREAPPTEDLEMPLGDGALEGLLDSPSPASRHKSLVDLGWLLPAALVIISIFVAVMWRRQNQPTEVRVEGHSVIVVDQKGRELWRHGFSTLLREADYSDGLQLVRYWLGDLGGDGERQLVFAAFPLNRMDGTPVLCFRADGRVRWQFVPGRAVPSGDDENVPPYFANSVEVVQGKRAADTRIVVSSNHYISGADQVAFLDVRGKVVGEYWHPGHLLHLAQVDLDGDGRKELLLGGVNNGNHQATLVVLDPVKVLGSVTPKDMRDHRFELLGMSDARERAVILFPRSCLSLGQPFNRVRSVLVTKARIVVNVAENMDERDENQIIYEMDYSLNVLNVQPGNGVVAAKTHQRLEAERRLDHSFNSERECSRLREEVVVRRAN